MARFRGQNRGLDRCSVQTVTAIVITRHLFQLHFAPAIRPAERPRGRPAAGPAAPAARRRTGPAASGGLSPGAGRPAPLAGARSWRAARGGAPAAAPGGRLHAGAGARYAAPFTTDSGSSSQPEGRRGSTRVREAG